MRGENKLKKVFIFLSVLIMLFSITISAFAESGNRIVYTENGYIEYFEDGSYDIVEIITDNQKTSRAVVGPKSKSISHYESNELVCTLTITGTFNYDGSSATCTNASVSYRIYNDNWKVTEAKASRSGATAKGEFTVKKYFLGVPIKTLNKTVTLTCSKNGVFS